MIETSRNMDGSIRIMNEKKLSRKTRPRFHVGEVDDRKFDFAKEWRRENDLSPIAYLNRISRKIFSREWHFYICIQIKLKYNDRFQN